MEHADRRMETMRHLGGLRAGPQIQHILTGGAAFVIPTTFFSPSVLYTGLVSLIIFVILMCLALHQAWQQRNPWGLYLFASLIALNFDGSKC
jgi:prolipoprotein diacylglyceryltransferase